MSKAILRFNLYQVFRSPRLFFKHPFFLKLGAQFFATNKGVSYFIRLILNLDQCEIQNIYYSSGTAKVFSRSHVYKIGTVYGSLRQEYIIANIIHERFPQIASYFPPIEYKKGLFLRTIKMDRYTVPQGPDSMDYANQILQTFAKYGVKQRCSMEEFPHILRGFKLAKILYKSIDLEAKVKPIFSVLWKIGPVHGDFHTGNVLVNDNRSPFVIDLDNFSARGIQAIDAFTFWLDYQTKETKMAWQDVIRSILKTDIYMGEYDIKLIAFLYILNRLGMENFYYGFLSHSVENEFRLLEELVAN